MPSVVTRRSPATLSDHVRSWRAATRHAFVIAALGLAGCGADDPSPRAAEPVSPCRPAAVGEECTAGEFTYLRAGRGEDLMLVLHGVGGSALDTAQTSLLHEDGDATVVYPSWTGRDVAYFRRLIAQLKPRGRTLIVGWSGGGFMVHRLACELDGIDAIAVLHAPLRGPCTKRDTAVLQIAGEEDAVIPFDGGRTPEGFISPPVRRAVARWRTLSPDVELHVEPGGHEWYPDATETIRRFFAR